MLYPLLLTSANEMTTIPAGVALFIGQHVIEYAILMAGSCLALAPILIVLCFNKNILLKEMRWQKLRDNECLGYDSL